MYHAFPVLNHTDAINAVCHFPGYGTSHINPEHLVAISLSDISIVDGEPIALAIAINNLLPDGKEFT